MWVTFLFAKEKEYFRTRKKKKGGGDTEGQSGRWPENVDCLTGKFIFSFGQKWKLDMV